MKFFSYSLSWGKNEVQSHLFLRFLFTILLKLVIPLQERTGRRPYKGPERMLEGCSRGHKHQAHILQGGKIWHVMFWTFFFLKPSPLSGVLGLQSPASMTLRLQEDINVNKYVILVVRTSHRCWLMWTMRKTSVFKNLPQEKQLLAYVFCNPHRYANSNNKKTKPIYSNLISYI